MNEKELSLGIDFSKTNVDEMYLTKIAYYIELYIYKASKDTDIYQEMKKVRETVLSFIGKEKFEKAFEIVKQKYPCLFESEV